MTAESLHPARPMMRGTADVANAVAHLTIDDRDIRRVFRHKKGVKRIALGGSAALAHERPFRQQLY